jgi:hypothetical protein
MTTTTTDQTTPDQLLTSFRSIAQDKPYVTEMDLHASTVPVSTMTYLISTMPLKDDTEEDKYDYERYLALVFGQSP